MLKRTDDPTSEGIALAWPLVQAGKWERVFASLVFAVLFAFRVGLPCGRSWHFGSFGRLLCAREPPARTAAYGFWPNPFLPVNVQRGRAGVFSLMTFNTPKWVTTGNYEGGSASRPPPRGGLSGPRGRPVAGGLALGRIRLPRRPHLLAPAGGVAPLRLRPRLLGPALALGLRRCSSRFSMKAVSSASTCSPGLCPNPAPPLCPSARLRSTRFVAPQNTRPLRSTTNIDLSLHYPPFQLRIHLLQCGP